MGKQISQIALIVRLQKFWDSLRHSLWFLPTTIVVGCIILAFSLIYIDGLVSEELIERFPRVFGAGAEGSRSMLAAIATSMITVAGVTFSITVVALTLASNQFSPRILRSFMSSRQTQVVLGTFLGIYAYCLVVLRTVRGAEEIAFVPSLAVLCGVILALVGVYVLIFFIHHIASTIQVSRIIADVTDETKQAIRNLFPTEVGRGEPPLRISPAPPLEGSWHPVLATIEGYIQTLDSENLLQLACERQCVIRMERAIGEFVVRGTPLVSLGPGVDVTEEDQKAVNALYICGRTRTVAQDATFGIQLLVDIALKALSPGVNDTTTALNCVDELSAVLAEAVAREGESKYRSKDQLRVIAKGPDFASLLADAFTPLRRNSNAAVLLRMLQAIEAIAYRTDDAHRRRHLLGQLNELRAEAERVLKLLQRNRE